MSSATQDGPAFGLISDDFTGGLLVASYFEEAGLASPVAFDPAALDPTAPIALLATRTRLMEPDAARHEITQALDRLEALGCGAVGYKACASFDSTDEGNIGLAANLLADRFGQNPLLISAGFPEFRATVHQGYLFYQGVLVNESIKRFDPVTPMSDPNLRRFLSVQAGAPVGLVSHLDLSGGIDTARAALDREMAAGHRHVLLDSSDDNDIAVSAVMARDVRAIVASDPLIIAYGMDHAGHRRARMTPPRHADTPGAVLVGSVGPVAEAQLAAFGAAHPVLSLDLLEDTTEAAQIDRALDWASPRIGAAPFAITTLTNEAGVKAAQDKLGRLGAARKAERLLAGVARGLHARDVRRLVVAGGETSGAVVGALGIASARALPRGPLGGGFCITDAPRPTSLFLKSGKLGREDVFLRALESMRP